MSDTHISFTGVDSLTYGVAERDKCRQFWKDWGLQAVTQGTRDCFQTLDASKVFLVDIDADGYAPAIEAGSTLRELTFGVQTEQDLATLKKLNITWQASTTDELVTIDPMGLQVRFHVSDRKPVQVTGSAINTYDQIGRGADQRTPVYAAAEPVNIGHCVLFCPDLDASLAFYRDQLGFVVSDYYPGTGYFLRCQQRGRHHDLFLLKTPDAKCGLNHVAFTVRDIHEVFGAGLALQRNGWGTQLGPGRHPVSSAYFWYFNNPCGGLAEYYSNDDYCTENWVSKEWVKSSENFAEWAIDGGIDGESRRQHKTS
jgi:catechol 2,3-dioxygenase